MKTIYHNLSSLSSLFSIFLMAFLLLGCTSEDTLKDMDNLSQQHQRLDDDDDEEIDDDLLEVVDALGGFEAINRVEALQLMASGQAFEFQEDDEPVNGFVADFTYELITSALAEAYRQSWSIQTDYAYESAFEFTETVEGTNGKSEGPTGFFSVEFGGFGVPGDPMYSTKVAARRKSIVMASPVLMLQYALQHPDAVETEDNDIFVRYNRSPQGFGKKTPDLALRIDDETGLPKKAYTLENDPLYGDALYEVRYAHWTTVNGIRYPTRITHVLNRNVIREVSLASVVVNPAISDHELNVSESEAFPYNEEEALAGYLSSQFHFRTLMQTFAIDFPVTLTEATNPFSVPSERLIDIVEDPKVLRIAGDLQSHYTFAFDLGDGLLIYDTPISDRRSKVVLQKIREVFGDKPIKYVVISHDHFDHAGGLRGILAKGGKLIVGAATERFYKKILRRPSTVVPNPLGRRGRAVDVIGLDEARVIGSGDDQVVLYILNSGHTPDHSYIAAYRPVSQSLFINDIHNPGFHLIFDTTTPDNQARLVRLAQDAVNFIDAEGLDVQWVVGTHGFTDETSISIETLRDLANRIPG